MKKIIFFLLFTYFIPICYSQNLSKIRVDPATTYGGPTSEYFSKIEYIPLETTKESAFGMARSLIITDSSIVVLDIDTWKILFFDLNGKFIKKYPIPQEVKTKNLGLFLEKDAANNTLVMNTFPIDKGFGETRIFSSMGNILSNKQRFYENGNVNTRIKLDSGFYAISTLNFIPIRKLPVDSTYALIQVYSPENTLQKTLFSLNPQENPFLFAYKGGVTVNPDYQNKTAYFSIPYDYRVFKITKDSLNEIGSFVFPTKNILPASMLKSKNYKSLDSLGQASGSSMQLIESVQNISFYQNLMFFTLQKKLTILPSAEGNIYDPLNFMYDTGKEKLISFERIFSDPFSFYLPIMDGTSSSSGMNQKDGYVYATVSSFQMFKAKDRNKSKNIKYPQILQKYFETQNRKSNPVIVKMKLKDL